MRRREVAILKILSNLDRAKRMIELTQGCSFPFELSQRVTLDNLALREIKDALAVLESAKGES